MECSIIADCILLVNGGVMFYILLIIALSTTKGENLKSPTIIVGLSIYSFSSVSYFSCILELCF